MTFDVEQFILDSLKKKLTTSQMVDGLQTKGINKTRKYINNKITLMRNKGIEIPFLKEIKMSSKVKTSPPKKKFREAEENISRLETGSFKVQKRIDGKSYQKTLQTLEEARTYRDNLAASIAKVDVTSVVTTSKPKRSYNRKTDKAQSVPTISQVQMSDVFETNEKFVVIISKDKTILSTLIEKMLE